MERVDQVQVVSGNSLAAEGQHRTALSLVICLYRQCDVVVRELNRVAFLLEKRDAKGALVALERACVSLVVADELVSLVSHECAHELETANRLRIRLLMEVVPELAAVRRELPGAASIVRSVLGDESRPGSAVSEALGRIDCVLGESPATSKPKRRS